MTLFFFMISPPSGEVDFQQAPVELGSPVFGQGKELVIADEAAAGGVTVGTVGTTAGPTKPTLGDTVSVGTAAAELTPRFPISVDPNGIPVRATPPGVVGDVGVEDEARLLEPEPHIPDMPEVSSIPDVIDIPDVAEIADEVDSPEEPDIPDAEVAGAAVPTAIPPPSKLAVDPNMDTGAVPMVEHVALLLGMEIVPVASPGAGLTPGDAISVEPSGIPVGETDEPVEGIPSGEVAAKVGVGLAIPLTCATAALQMTSAAGIAAINDNLTGKRARMELLRRIWP
ncbi:hypothetical protein [Bradyrhizobium sp.]|jgi:hypothetical protein|uniref:hypothetical protein n=1 Tax=Bradyrhizobium sp. TaxID=376 RepID=UPI002DFADC2F|nr:hypothetical protein [Bradyrhizobium sp.]